MANYCSNLCRVQPVHATQMIFIGALKGPRHSLSVPRQLSARARSWPFQLAQRASWKLSVFAVGYLCVWCFIPGHVHAAILAGRCARCGDRIGRRRDHRSVVAAGRNKKGAPDSCRGTLRLIATQISDYSVFHQSCSGPAPGQSEILGANLHCLCCLQRLVRRVEQCHPHRSSPRSTNSRSSSR